jgi:hypothetical protein
VYTKFAFPNFWGGVGPNLSSGADVVSVTVPPGTYQVHGKVSMNNIDQDQQLGIVSRFQAP